MRLGLGIAGWLAVFVLTGFGVLASLPIRNPAGFLGGVFGALLVWYVVVRVLKAAAGAARGGLARVSEGNDS
jgi:hypothetical protein